MWAWGGAALNAKRNGGRGQGAGGGNRGCLQPQSPSCRTHSPEFLAHTFPAVTSIKNLKPTAESQECGLSASFRRGVLFIIRTEWISHLAGRDAQPNRNGPCRRCEIEREISNYKGDSPGKTGSSDRNLAGGDRTRRRPFGEHPLDG